MYVCKVCIQNDGNGHLSFIWVSFWFLEVTGGSEFIACVITFLFFSHCLTLSICTAGCQRGKERIPHAVHLLAYLLTFNHVWAKGGYSWRGRAACAMGERERIPGYTVTALDWQALAAGHEPVRVRHTQDRQDQHCEVRACYLPSKRTRKNAKISPAVCARCFLRWAGIRCSPCLTPDQCRNCVASLRRQHAYFEVGHTTKPRQLFSSVLSQLLAQKREHDRGYAGLSCDSITDFMVEVASECVGRSCGS